MAVTAKHIFVMVALDITPQQRDIKLMSLFLTDKTQLIIWILGHYNVKYNPSKSGYQKVSCLNHYGHTKGDRNPSASVHILNGSYNCFACGLAGDGYTILKALEGWGVKQVNDAFGGNPINESESDVWI